jgi:hypothetical protein
MFAQAQWLNAGVRLNSLYTTRKPFYQSEYGFGAGVFARATPVRWAFIQGEYDRYSLFGSQDLVQQYRMRNWSWHIGLTPSKKFPLTVCFGPLLHKYIINTNAIVESGMVFIPALKLSRKWDGWSVGLMYPITKGIEVSVIYDTEPLFRYDDPETADYLRFTLSFDTRMLRKEKSDD